MQQSGKTTYIDDLVALTRHGVEPSKQLLANGSSHTASRRFHEKKRF